MDSVVTFFSDAGKYIASMGGADFFDILILAALIYWVFGLIRRTNSFRIAGVLAMLALVLLLSDWFNLSVTNYIIRKVFSIGFIAVIVLFQPEIRRSFERFGARSFSFLTGDSNLSGMESVLMQTVFACVDMARTRTGALIVFEKNNRLNEAMGSGTELDALVSADLLKNLFYDKSPLHDGAVIIRGGRIAAAGCMLPLSTNAGLSRDLGMRHRAGLGMSEKSDAIVVIVSEETGGISVAMDGLLKRYLSQDMLEELLRRQLLPDEEKREESFLRRLLGKGDSHGA